MPLFDALLFVVVWLAHSRAVFVSKPIAFYATGAVVSNEFSSFFQPFLEPSRENSIYTECERQQRGTRFFNRHSEQNTRSSNWREPTPIQSGLLDVDLHLGYLGRHLLQGLPARYTSQDASHPWLLFWSFQSLSLLKVELDQGNKHKAVEGILAMQNTTEGGFGGGPGQAAHLLPTYAAVCSLAIVGAPDPSIPEFVSPWTRIDRRALYRLVSRIVERRSRCKGCVLFIGCGQIAEYDD
ncbi:terpenoid cyclases/protein prenyltransferase alpha-alpha toroid [Lentinula detonsa]|uniref:Terpenoid cyclases/protein prenyltransferase alpha-alpha toroid n=1 Tax=Lentinula detonsa TaxID=2804962 RepID=A0AA38PYL8_9AGAR|nr:terpenoid cyclases/protein prenyltransferase alpha-alpha toroid [Lentinula detonsa]